VEEVPLAREVHRYAGRLGCCDDFFVVHRATGLNDRRDGDGGRTTHHELSCSTTQSWLVSPSGPFGYRSSQSTTPNG